jgi:hypothetical protein
MKTSIFVPETIKVGFQNRSDTYTKKLAYVIYYDQKGKVRKEASWNSWRNKEIPDVDFKNTPTSGFVLNKKVGGDRYGWNPRQTYVRVYDPRDFEFEISIPNLLYILENTNSIKGKGLEGEFIYGWDGTELVLLPVSSPDYQEILQYNSIVRTNTHVKAKDLVIGGTYRDKKNFEWIYMGKYDYYYWNGNADPAQHYFFARYAAYRDDRSDEYIAFNAVKTLGNRFIAMVSSDCHPDYANIFDKLEHDNQYSPVDVTKDEYLPYTLEEFADVVNRYSLRCYGPQGIGTFHVYKGDTYHPGQCHYYKDDNNGSFYRSDPRVATFEQAYREIQPMYRRVYLANGKLYREEKKE